MSLKEIIEKYQHPIIGIVGASTPLPGYNPREAKDLGYKLRDFVEKGGSLFTGGVPGVGLDVYEGIVGYCEERGVEDKFFVMLPTDISPPQEYFDLASRTKNGKLIVESAGKDMEERRDYVAEVADSLVVINGGMGTIDEAVKGLYSGKEVLCLSNSGGAAEILSKLRLGEIPKLSDMDVDMDLIKTCNSPDEIIGYLINNKLYKQLRGE